MATLDRSTCDEMVFSDPQVILFVADCERAAAFYRQFGFRETFRMTKDGTVKVEMVLNGFGLGLACPETAAEHHGIDPVTHGHRACITVWTTDVDGAYRMALRAGAADHSPPHSYLDGRLRVAFVEDPDGHPVQLVQRVRPTRTDRVPI